jgi:hypothetical protein
MQGFLASEPRGSSPRNGNIAKGVYMEILWETGVVWKLRFQAR